MIYSETQLQWHPLLREFHDYANIQKEWIFTLFIFVKITSLQRLFRTMQIYYKTSVCR